LRGSVATESGAFCASVFSLECASSGVQLDEPLVGVLARAELEPDWPITANDDPSLDFADTVVVGERAGFAPFSSATSSTASGMW
jgi:hypothetical protein